MNRFALITALLVSASASASEISFLDIHGRTCRRLTSEVQIDKQTVTATVVACLIDGEWVFQGTPPPTAAIQRVKPTITPTPIPPPSPQIAAEPGDEFRRRGDAALSIGDIAAARLEYQWAVNKGNALAAFRIGKTYDPTFLREIGAHGIKADPDEASHWYQRAVTMRERHEQAVTGDVQ